MDWQTILIILLVATIVAPHLLALYRFIRRRRAEARHVGALALAARGSQGSATPGLKCNARRFRFERGEAVFHPACEGILLESVTMEVARRSAGEDPGQLLEVKDEVHFL